MKFAAAAALALIPIVGCASGQSTGDDDDVDARVIDAATIDSPGVEVDAAAIDAPATDAGAVDAPTDAAVPIDAPVDGMTTGAVDTCAQALDVSTAAMAAGGTTVTGDTTTYANNVEPATACTGYGNDGPDAIYQVTVPAGRVITAALTTSWDAAIEIVQPCAMVPTCLDGTDGTVGAGTETATFTTTAAGTYFIVVDSYLPTVYGTYSLNVRVQ